jgi:3-oxoadipate enol-lactonase
MQELAPRAVAAMVGPDADPRGVALAESCLAATAAETYRAMVHCLVTFDERANLAHIRVPVLVLAAEADPNAPASMMRKMAGYIPGARFVMLPGVGHLANVEKPDLFNEAVEDFLQSALQRDRAGVGR